MPVSAGTEVRMIGSALRPHRVDLHVHTALSPCGDLEMGAPQIVERAREVGLDLMAVTDHNSCENYPALAGVPGSPPPVLIPGIEVQSEEDIHLVCLFPAYEEALAFKDWLWLRMPGRLNDPDIFGDQPVIDSENRILRFEEVLLVQGISRSVDEIALEARERGGLVILAHVDRPAFSYEAVLGPVPPDFPADALEISAAADPAKRLLYRERYPDRVLIRSSDSHSLASIRPDRASSMLLAKPTFEELRKALRNEEGRCVLSPESSVSLPGTAGPEAS
jgi:PHP family Zn ribbon phosphoesterase